MPSCHCQLLNRVAVDDDCKSPGGYGHCVLSAMALCAPGGYTISGTSQTRQRTLGTFADRNRVRARGHQMAANRFATRRSPAQTLAESRSLLGSNGWAGARDEF